MDVGPPDVPRCVVCGKEIGAGEPWWVVDHANGVHQSCRDWSKAPFPYTWRIDSLRKLYRRLARAQRHVCELGRWLAKVERDWPKGAPDVLTEISARVEKLAKELERIGLGRKSTRL